MSSTMLLALILASVLLLILLVWKLRRLSLQALVTIIMGVVIGLVIGALVSVPMGMLPDPYGTYVPMIAAAAIVLLTIAVVSGHKSALIEMLPFLQVEAAVRPARQSSSAASSAASAPRSRVLVDTSAIIDGRIADVAAAGFLPPTFVVPRFVLAELQNIADSEDAMRRGRGRRGLEVLNRMRDTPGFSVEVTDEDVEGIREVDAKLVALAQRFGCDVLTTDFNLNRVAQIQGVRVLNVNELSNAIRPVVIPGEEMIVHVVQPGKERGQGVGYLSDGTMIVVENGDKLIGQDVATEVTRVFQTVAGKMIFAVPRPMHGAKSKQSASEHKQAVIEQKQTPPAQKQSLATPKQSAPEPKAPVEPVKTAEVKQTPAETKVAPAQGKAARDSRRRLHDRPQSTTQLSTQSAAQAPAQPLVHTPTQAPHNTVSAAAQAHPTAQAPAQPSSNEASAERERRPNHRHRRLSPSAAIEERLVAGTAAPAKQAPAASVTLSKHGAPAGQGTPDRATRLAIPPKND